MTSYDDRQAHPLPCVCGRNVSNREHCDRWIWKQVTNPNMRGIPDCPLETFHGRRYAQPDREECE